MEDGRTSERWPVKVVMTSSGARMSLCMISRSLPPVASMWLFHARQPTRARWPSILLTLSDGMTMEVLILQDNFDSVAKEARFCGHRMGPTQ